MAKRSGVKIRTTVYGSFRGVDFTTDPAMVDRQRSPYAVNMIGDEGGAPEKRPGTRILHKFGAKINGIHIYKVEQGSASGISGTNILEQTITPTINAVKLYEKTKETGTYSVVGYHKNVGTAPLVLVEEKLTITINGNVRFEYSYAVPAIIGGRTIGEDLTDYGISPGTAGYAEDDNGYWQFNITFTLASASKNEKVIHSGTNFYKYENGTATLLLANVPSKRSTSINMSGKLWIFTGEGFYKYDGLALSLVRSGDVYVPTTVIGCVAGSTPGGSSYEGINYLSSKQKVGFLAVTGEKVYHLPYQDITSVNTVTVDGTWINPELYTVDLSAGTVTFNTAPSPPAAGAEDNVFITFTKSLAGYGDTSVIDKCDVAVAWGYGGAENRIVCTGCPTYKNRDYISAYNDPTYFPDTDYQVVGSDSIGIAGYRKLSSYLMIVKADNGIEPSIYIRSASMNDDGSVAWATFPCISGVGGVSKDGFGNINDDQLVLTGNGVYAITSNSITSEKIAEARSTRVNPKMLKETLSSARVASFKNLLMVFFPNGHVYILDGKHSKTYENKNETTFTYEGYYWEDINASCVATDKDSGIESIYFGKDDGCFCEIIFNDETIQKYSDELPCTWTDTEEYGILKYTSGAWKDLDGQSATLAEYGVTITFTPQEDDMAVIDEDDGARYYRAIKSVWSTKADDDGDPMILKTLLKKGNAITMKPYTRSSGQVCIRTDKDAVDWKCNELSMDIFDWEDIDFSRFTFNANDAPREIPFNRKVKNYKRLQIIARNEKVNEGFGVYGIVKHYVTGNFAKR